MQTESKSLSLRKRILKANGYTLLLSVMLIIGVVVIAVVAFLELYLNSTEGNTRIDKNAYLAASAIKEFDGNEYSDIETALRGIGYEYLVEENANVVYESIGKDLLKKAKEIKIPDEKFTEPRFLVHEEYTLVVLDKETTDKDIRYICIRKSPSDTLFSVLNSGIAPIILAVFIVIAVGATLIIVFVSGNFTKKTVNHIMVPMKKLMDASKSVESGSLDAHIDYSGEQEFETVCNTFNEMLDYLIDSNNKNKAYEKARTEMIAGISHDLRTPLTSIKGYVKGIRDGVADTPEKQAHYLDVIYRKTEETEILLQKLFYFSKLETGNLPMKIVKIDVMRFIEDFVAENEEETAARGGILTVINRADAYAYADEDSLRRIIVNVTENSIKYKSKEKVNVRIGVYEEGKEVRIEISDDGDGVPEGKIGHIFELFYRADETRNSGKNGSGLGLYVAKTLLEKMNGSITARNGNGLIVTITLHGAQK